MALNGLASAAARRDGKEASVRVVDAQTGEEHVLRFRRPTRYDIQPGPAVLEKVEATCKQMRLDTQLEVVLLASCYIPEAGEGKVDPIAQFAHIARESDLLFDEISRGFGEAFPEYSNWLGTRLAAGNASGEGSEPSDDASGGSPSGSDASPASSPT